ncbi:MAG: nitroreductase family deazaflavin-dependent oxidoreductase [Chloroflexi bacterium AL-W]|nr:nitroreductase family deazaflavin-dependent oxidoreductase [Chloroflexi bacterium AL-N1]NOK70489.1 nitroreductase family deazaflavin-dependent oxidoreductase [Chloroflexi bacterium AL-N10]NOK78152.1 nitroreductase family deazaflavin-dependent oxidoreductase [Chloroflexi bacterium AL-N5]NOK85251.1 nitroreductase family deazaflavin-dependent oxidoreductase [Chloroflexi bacterium AL-W]NOK92016.1 nitroreductase family deazaflavin-dependent oxidoreductase [Chloroflexi bacterium AL-N15]
MALANEDFCYLTTTGRISGRPHTIEIWFVMNDHTLYMLSGARDRADWVKNLQRRPAVTVRIDQQHFKGHARVIGDQEEDALARHLVVGKYQPGENKDLSSWGRTALAVAIDLYLE